MARGEKPYLTKVWVGRRWKYFHTKRRYDFAVKRKIGVISYLRQEAEVGE